MSPRESCIEPDSEVRSGLNTQKNQKPNTQHIATRRSHLRCLGTGTRPNRSSSMTVLRSVPSDCTSPALVLVDRLMSLFFHRPQIFSVVWQCGRINGGEKLCNLVLRMLMRQSILVVSFVGSYSYECGQWIVAGQVTALSAVDVVWSK